MIWWYLNILRIGLSTYRGIDDGWIVRRVYDHLNKTARHMGSYTNKLREGKKEYKNHPVAFLCLRRLESQRLRNSPFFFMESESPFLFQRTHGAGEGKKRSPPPSLSFLTFPSFTFQASLPPLSVILPYRLSLIHSVDLNVRFSLPWCSFVFRFSVCVCVRWIMIFIFEMPLKSAHNQ